MNNLKQKVGHAMIEENIPSTLNFFRLTLIPGTFKLDRNTLNKFSDFELPKWPYLNISVRKIDFKDELWTLGVVLKNEEEEKVYLKITPTEVLISCSVDTDETYLSKYAYCALIRLMYSYDEYDFESYYWPDLSDIKMQNRFLMILSSRGGLNVMLKARYKGLYKPGKYLPAFEKDTTDISREEEVVNEIPEPDFDQVIGYSLSDTRLNSCKTSHYPFLLPYTGSLNRDKSYLKSFSKFILSANDVSDFDLSPIQEELNEICFSMKAIALVKPYYKTNEYKWVEIQNSNNNIFSNLFKLWHQALPLLLSWTYTHYHFTFGMRYLKGKPKKSNMIPCTFNGEAPKICFLWIEKSDYYKLELRFILQGRIHELPQYFKTYFFVATAEKPTDYYLLNSIVDCNVLLFFAETDFKILVLKAHYELHFKRFTDQLRTLYKFIERK